MEVFMLLREKLLDSYYPIELVLIKGKNQQYNFAVNYFPGVDAVKILNGDHDCFLDEVEFADFFLTDPDNMCLLSHNNTIKPFRSHFIKDFHYGKSFDNPLEFREIKKAADLLMNYQEENGKMPLKEILAVEKKLNQKIKNVRSQFSR